MVFLPIYFTRYKENEKFMINHTVLFKLNEYLSDEKESILSELKELLYGLKDKIPEIEFIKVDFNFQLLTNGYDMILITHFKSVADLDKYRVHPEHIKVVNRITETTQSRAALDYVF